MTERLVVVGGDAAGMSAASQALRSARQAGRALEVVALERGDYTSYSACGIPYWVGDEADGPAGLIARTPAEHRERGIDLRMRSEVTGLDPAANEVCVLDRDAGREYRLGYDRLLLATGAEPIRPDLPGIGAAGVYTVHDLTDGAALRAALADRPRHAIVVGGGYIGLELAEALHRRGLDGGMSGGERSDGGMSGGERSDGGMSVTVIHRGAQPMSTLDPDMGMLVAKAMRDNGIELVLGTGVDEMETEGGRVRAVRAGGRSYPADLVVLGLGVRPATGLAAAAGLPLGESGGLRVDMQQRVVENIWAAGDCVECYDRVGRRWVHVALGPHANRQGWVAGTNIGGGYATFPGILGTAVTKVCDTEIGRTGLRAADAQRLGFRYVATTIEATTRAGYYPGAAPLTVKLLAELGTGRLLGAQIVGGPGSAKRIDTCAVALWNELTVAELAVVDLSYAPPFSPVFDPVTVAARRAATQV